MRRSTVTAIIIVLALIILGALFYQANQRTATVTSPSPSPSERPSAAASPSASLNSSPATSATPVTVDFTSSGFSPRTITVASGTTITFKNSTSEEVQPSSNPHPQHTLNPELNVGIVQPGGSKTVTATQKGSWGMHDHLDPSMTLTVVVQ
jgi:plastocyanin